MDMFVGGLIGAILSVIATAIFLPLIQDPITDFLSTRLSNPFGLKKSFSLSGNWTQNWQVEGRPTISHPDSKLELKQFGNSLVGTFTFDGRPYRLRAKIENNIFVSGIWFDRTSGQTYHGTFQARIEVDQKIIEGKWVGFSKSMNTFNTGPWKWERIT